MCIRDSDYAAKMTSPLLIVSPESERPRFAPIVDKLTGDNHVVHVGDQIVHGSRTLFLTADNTKEWEVVERFLAKHLK